MVHSARSVWLLRAALIGTPLLFWFLPVLGGLVLATLVGPGLAHFLIREDQAAVRPKRPLVARGPLHDLALVFVAAPLIWSVLSWEGASGSYDATWTLSGLWLVFQCAIAATLLHLGRSVLFPVSWKGLKPWALMLPWLVMATVYAVGWIRFQGGQAIRDQRFWLSTLLTVLAWAICIRLVKNGLTQFDGSQDSLERRAIAAWKSLSGWYRGGTRIFVLAPWVWVALWGSLCWHAWALGESPPVPFEQRLSASEATSDLDTDLSDSNNPDTLVEARERPMSLVLHKAIVDDIGLIIGFVFPVFALWILPPLRWIPDRSRRTLGMMVLLGSWILAGLVLVADPWGWLGWYLR